MNRDPKTERMLLRGPPSPAATAEAVAALREYFEELWVVLVLVGVACSDVPRIANVSLTGSPMVSLIQSSHDGYSPSKHARERTSVSYPVAGTCARGPDRRGKHSRVTRVRNHGESSHSCV